MKNNFKFILIIFLIAFAVGCGKSKNIAIQYKSDDNLNKIDFCSDKIEPIEKERIVSICAAEINQRLKSINEKRDKAHLNNISLIEYNVFSNKSCALEYSRKWDVNVAFGSESTIGDLDETDKNLFVGIINVNMGYRVNGTPYVYNVPFYCDIDGLLPVSLATLSPPSGSDYPVQTSKNRIKQYGDIKVNQTFILQGRVIDIYQDSNIITFQTIDGKEEIIQFSEQLKNLVKKIEINSEIEIKGTSLEGELYIGNSIDILKSNSLKFSKDLVQLTYRKNSAPLLSGSTLYIGPFQKPASLVFISPSGGVLSPHFTSIPGASYSKEKYEGENSTHTIIIPFAQNGTWGLKVIPEPGYDKNITLYLSYIIDPAKTLEELSNNIIYFKIPPREQLEK